MGLVLGKGTRSFPTDVRGGGGWVFKYWLFPFFSFFCYCFFQFDKVLCGGLFRSSLSALGLPEGWITTVLQVDDCVFRNVCPELGQSYRYPPYNNLQLLLIWLL